MVGGGGGTRTTAEDVFFLVVDLTVAVLLTAAFPSDLELFLTSVFTSVFALLSDLAGTVVLAEFMTGVLVAGAAFLAGSTLAVVLAWAGAAAAGSGLSAAKQHINAAKHRLGALAGLLPLET